MDPNSTKYIPCLRWKLGEYQALLRLSHATKNSIMPLIEIPEIGFDFQTRKQCKSIDEHLSKFAKRVWAKWQERHCFVDMHLVAPFKRMENGQHPFAFVFDDLRKKGALAIPVISLKQDSSCDTIIKATVASDRRGLCIRIGIEEARKSNLKASLEQLLERNSAGIGECDFILDLGAPNFEPIKGLGKLLEAIIRELPFLDKWRSFILLGTSFPQSMRGLPQGLSIIERNEWRLYKHLAKLLKASATRIPTFGDYGISHPAVIAIDMRFVKPFASVRYTIDDSWLIAKGPNVRDYGLGQYRQLCRDVIDSKHYCGQVFSEGDKYIYDCAQGAATTGNLTTWRWVGTNHHLEKVVQDLASLYDS